MKEIQASQITKTVKELCMNANYHLGADVLKILQVSKEKEKSATGIAVLNQILENAKIADTENVPMCQDTGFTVVFVKLGQDAHIVGDTLENAINEGVRQGYQEGYLRKSIVKDPLRRVNTGDNTPAVIWIDSVPGDKLEIEIEPKGGGSENMSGISMLKPADGIEGVKKFIIDRVFKSGSNPCPPIIVGVGIGGTFEKCAQLAKKATLRELGKPNADPFYADLEKELLTEINKLGLGPMGLGGETTALAVHIETYPCHIASLPVAVNIQCHAARHKKAIL